MQLVGPYLAHPAELPEALPGDLGSFLDSGMADGHPAVYVSAGAVCTALPGSADMLWPAAVAHTVVVPGIHILELWPH